MSREITRGNGYRLSGCYTEQQMINYLLYLRSNEVGDPNDERPRSSNPSLVTLHFPSQP